MMNEVKMSKCQKAPTWTSHGPQIGERFWRRGRRLLCDYFNFWPVQVKRKVRNCVKRKNGEIFFWWKNSTGRQQVGGTAPHTLCPGNVPRNWNDSGHFEQLFSRMLERRKDPKISESGRCVQSRWRRPHKSRHYH